LIWKLEERPATKSLLGTIRAANRKGFPLRGSRASHMGVTKSLINRKAEPILAGRALSGRPDPPEMGRVHNTNRALARVAPMHRSSPGNPCAGHKGDRGQR
jgi:hypothetical protein